MRCRLSRCWHREAHFQLLTGGDVKVVLIQTPWSEASAREYKGVAKRYALYPPLGLMCLGASVKQAGHEAEVIDLEVETLPFDELCGRIRRMDADLIGITTTTPVFHIAQAFARALRHALRLPIVVGGPHITVLKEETFTEDFDFGVIQEGQDTLCELMDALAAGATEFGAIKGLVWRREDGSVVVNEARPFATDLDALPMPARDMVDPGNYAFEVPGKGLVPVATIELTRGCPFQCVFCSEPLNTGRVLRRRSAKSVVDEMVYVKEKFGISHFMTLDSTLTLNRKLIEGICHEIIDRGIEVTWEGQTRANLVDEPLLVLLQQAGLVRMSFGVESADDGVLEKMRKKVDPGSMREAFRLCKKLGISTLCGLMMGNPGDTRETILKTAWFVRSIPEIRYAPMAIAIPYPGTELAYFAKNQMHGLRLLELDYSKYSRYAGGVMEVGGMMPDELIRLQRRALVIVHSTPAKAFGLISHFGFWTVVKIASRQLRNELVVLFGGKEPSLRSNVAEENTTLKSLGVTFQS